MGRLRGREHASTPQSWVEAPRLVKRKISQIVLLFLCCVCCIVCIVHCVLCTVYCVSCTVHWVVVVGVVGVVGVVVDVVDFFLFRIRFHSELREKMIVSRAPGTIIYKNCDATGICVRSLGAGCSTRHGRCSDPPLSHLGRGAARHVDPSSQTSRCPSPRGNCRCSSLQQQQYRWLSIL